MPANIKIFALLLCFVVSCSSSKDPYEGQYIDLAFEEKLVFGQSDSVPEAHLYRIEGVKKAINNRIYVADAGASKIKIYSSGGEFISSFGKRGRGPGEFGNIQGFSLLDSTIYVWDQSLQRISLYNLDGRLIETVKLEGIASPIKMISMGGAHLLLYPSANTKPSNMPNVKLAHEYKADFSDNTANFLRIKDLNDAIVEASRFLLSFPGSIMKENSHNFLFIPSIYSGNIYKFTKQSSG